jgi:hypothetical protein
VHEALPPILMYQGKNDINCPMEDTEHFCALLKQHYTSRYNNDTAYLKTVTELSGKEILGVQGPVAKGPHRFNYMILEEHEPWLKEVHAKIDAHWSVTEES